MDHRDGSGPAVFPAGRVVPYIMPDEVVWPDEQDGAHDSHKSAIRFRKAQLDFRRREIYEALRSVRLMAAGKHVESGLKALDVHDFDFPRWEGHIHDKDVELVGHSFGGATIVSDYLEVGSRWLMTCCLLSSPCYQNLRRRCLRRSDPMNVSLCVRRFYWTRGWNLWQIPAPSRTQTVQGPLPPILARNRNS